MKPVNKLEIYTIFSSSSQIRGGSFGRLANPLTEDTTYTARKWQDQDRNPGLLLPVIVLDAMRDPGPCTMLGVYLPGVPSLERDHRHGLPYQTGCDACLRCDIPYRSVEGCCLDIQELLHFNMGGNPRGSCLGWGPRFFISNGLPGDAHTTGPH